MIEQTITQLNQLKLSGMAKALAGQLKQPSSYEAYPSKNDCSYSLTVKAKTENTESNSGY